MVIKQFKIPSWLNRTVLIQVYNEHRALGLPISYARIGSIDFLRGAGILLTNVGENYTIKTYDQIYPVQVDERVGIGIFEVTYGASQGYGIGGISP